LDTLKEAVDTIFYRAKSPLFGSIILSTVVWNWKSFAYLFWAERPIRSRFMYFDENFSFWQPLLIGLLLFVLNPTFKFLGSLVAEYPTHWARMRQLKYDDLYETKKIDLKETRDRAIAAKVQNLIEETKAEIEIDAIPEDKRGELKQKIDELRAFKGLTQVAKEIIFRVGNSSRKQITFMSALGGRSYSIDDWGVEEKDKRMFASFRSAMEELEYQNLIEPHGTGGHFFDLTGQGFELFDKLIQSDFELAVLV